MCLELQLKTMDQRQSRYNYLEQFLDSLRARGRYCFTYHSALDTVKRSEQALDRNLNRLIAKGKISRVMKGFYLVIPPEYFSRGTLPLPLFIDDLMKALERDYYVGLFSAAAIHGASHQQPMESYVIIKQPAMRVVRGNKLTINFLMKKEWYSEHILKMKTDVGYMNVSSPELTALDLLYYSHRFSMNRIFTVYQELVEAMDPARLEATAKHYPQTAAIQRLGFLLDKELHQEKLTRALMTALQERRYSPVLLVPGPDRSGKSDPDWKIIKNTIVEGDL